LLANIETITPWSELWQVLDQACPSGDRGRPPIGLERMLRMYVVEHPFHVVKSRFGHPKVRYPGLAKNTA
jgi:hypothetical protein